MSLNPESRNIFSNILETRTSFIIFTERLNVFQELSHPDFNVSSDTGKHLKRGANLSRITKVGSSRSD